MKNLEFLTPEIFRSFGNYGRMGIDFKYLGKKNDYYYFSITQKRMLNGYVLSQNQLLERAYGIFKHIDEKIRIEAITFSLDIRQITPKWILKQMDEFDIKRNDIVTHLHIDKSTLSLYLNGERNMSRMGKAAFYWYFSSFRVNRDLREEFST